MESTNVDTVVSPFKGKSIVIIVSVVCVLFIIASMTAFFWGRERFKFDDGYVLDNSLWGTLGDFVGGILGSILTALSFLMMYWTFNAQQKLTSDTNQLQESLQRELNDKAATLQMDLNAQAVKQAELQRFNDMFFELLSLYHRQKQYLDAIEGVDGSFFNFYMKQLQHDFKEYLTFGRARRYAGEKFIDFYLEHSAEIAPVFRTLYRLFLITDNAPIDNDKKLDYAKTVRAQLSEGELFFLRYNCMSGYGRKFTDLVNKYRIIKHLPFLSLLENTSLRNKLVMCHSENGGLALNWLAYSIFKEIYNRIVGKTTSTGRMETFLSNSRYCLSFSVEKSKVILELKISTKNRNNTPALKCLDSLGIDTIEKLLSDLLREIFLFSNSKVYNDESSIKCVTEHHSDSSSDTLLATVKMLEGKLRLSHRAWDEYYGFDDTVDE